MSGWTHLLCDDCYAEVEPYRDPSRVRHDIGTCCRCGDITVSGIYYRADPGEYRECDHEGGRVRVLVKTVEMLQLHVENLIERVAALEGTHENCSQCGEWFGDRDQGCDACVELKWGDPNA